MATKSDILPKRRRWLRFSLRGILMIIAISAVAFAWVGYRAQRQRTAVRWVWESGGYVTYRYEQNIHPPVKDLNYSTSSVFIQEPPVPDWLLNILDINHFSDVIEVDLAGTEIKDVAPLAQLTKLELLDLRYTQISAAQIESLKQILPNCEILGETPKGDPFAGDPFGN